MKKMVHLMHLDGFGGGPVVVNELVRRFSKTFEVSVIAGGKGRVAEACREGGLPFYSIASDRLWKCPFAFLQILLLFSRIRPDVLILHGQWGGPLAAPAARLLGIPVVLYVAHSPSFYHKQTLKNAIRGYISEWIPCSLVDAVVVLSEGNFYQYLLRGWGGEGKLYLIHNGIEQDKRVEPEAVAALRKKWDWKAGTKHVLFLGRLDRQKRVDWLLQAWALLNPGKKDAELWLVGTGPIGDKIQKMAEDLGLAESCRFLPDQPNGREFIAASDFVVLPSLYEGHALVPLETMAEGVAFVGTAVDGIVDSIQDGVQGFLVPPGDIKALAEAIKKLLDDSILCREMGKKGLEQIKKFHWDRSFQLYDELIQTLLAEKAI